MIRKSSSFKDNIWDADLADIQLIIKCNRRIRFSLCIINIFSDYAWIFLLKDKKGITITNSFNFFFDESNRKPNKIWVEKGSEFYNWSINHGYKTMI